MKRIFITILLSSLIFMVGSAHALTSVLKETDIEAVALKVANETVQGGYQLISMEEVKQMIDAKEDFVLIDAHPKWEFDMAYIDGAKHFGFKSNRVGKWADDVDMAGAPSQDDYRKVLGSDKNKKIVIYCGFTKCGRSHNAAMWARQLGYTNVYRAPGGITAWRDLGYSYKVVPNSSNTYPSK